jgi:hypothetical protein
MSAIVIAKPRRRARRCRAHRGNQAYVRDGRIFALANGEQALEHRCM